MRLGFDFLHNYLGVRDWLAGNNPYTHLFGDPTLIPYNYAPICLGLFIWCGWVNLVPAVIGWSIAIAVIVAFATWYAAKLRPQFGPKLLPLPFALAAMLLCTPVVFSMERGNCDALALLALVGAVIALKKNSRTGDGIAGVCLALATLIKVYPALAVLGLLPLRRIRPLWTTVFAGLLISRRNPCTLRSNGCTTFTPTHYAITFPSKRMSIPSADFGHISLIAMASAPCCTYRRSSAPVSYCYRSSRLTGVAIYRSDRRALLAFPYLLWLTQAASFWSPVSYDYKLLFLPLVMLCLWKRRSPWYARLARPIPALLATPPYPPTRPHPRPGDQMRALVGGAILIREAANRDANQRAHALNLRPRIKKNHVLADHARR